MPDVATRPNLPAYQYAISDGAHPLAEPTDHGTWLVKGMKIFKAATFKDSRGRKKTWTSAELQQIVSNFETLRSENILPYVPVRADHGVSIDKVKGYIAGLNTDGNFLYGDVEFTEQDGADKWNRKTYRSRSIEVGAYETNGVEPTTYFPCALGLAFVDIGAVEGLYRNSNTGDDPVPELATFRIRGTDTTNVEQVQTHIDTLEAAGTPAPHAFRVAGAEQADYAAVQAHIDTLEAFRTESFEAARDGFVDELVKANKVLAPQADGLKTFAKSLSPEQYNAWKSSYEGAPTMFGKHAGDGNGSKDNQGGKSKTELEAATALEVIRSHARTEMPLEKLKTTASYRRYVAITGNEPELS